MIEKQLKKLAEPRHPPQQERLKTACVPYLKGTSERAQKILKKINVNLFNQSCNTLKN